MRHFLSSLSPRLISIMFFLPPLRSDLSFPFPLAHLTREGGESDVCVLLLLSSPTSADRGREGEEDTPPPPSVLGGIVMPQNPLQAFLSLFPCVLTRVFQQGLSEPLETEGKWNSPPQSFRMISVLCALGPCTPVSLLYVCVSVC